MSFKLTILGSSGALPAYGRFPSAQYLNIGNHHFLIDCGEGTQLQLKRFQIPLQKIDHIFISHLHGDHYLGLMGLLFSMHLHRRTNELHIYSIPGLDEIITLQLKHSKSVLNFNLRFHPITTTQPTLIFEDDILEVRTIPLRHKIVCNGFLFKEKKKPRRIDKKKLKPGMLLQHIAQLKTGVDIYDDKNELLYKNEDYTLPPRHSFCYAYCSDTVFDESLVDLIAGADLLYHEATFMTEELGKAIETLHSTAAQAGVIAQKAKVKQLVIGHFSARYKELEPLLAEAQKEFPNTSLAIEGETIDLDSHDAGPDPEEE